MCENEIQQEASRLFAVSEAVAGFLERTHAKNVALRAEVDKLKNMANDNYIQRLKHLQSDSSPEET